jgi:ADP-ribose pyrophosphatase YjhB (NUDIX family)
MPVSRSAYPHGSDTAMTSAIIAPHYCTTCGITLPVGAVTHHRCEQCRANHPAEALVLVSCCVTQGERLLWIRRAEDPRRGFWGIPGGYLELGETTSQAVVRELAEETGLIVDPSLLHLHGLGSVTAMNQVYVVYGVQVDCATLSPGPEVLEARFFSESEMPWDEIAFPTASYLARLTYRDMRRGHRGTYLAQPDVGLYIDQSDQQLLRNVKV